MSSFYHGAVLRLSVFGQSHAEAVGMTLDGLPAGLPLDLQRLQRFLTAAPPGGTTGPPPAGKRTARNFSAA